MNKDQQRSAIAEICGWVWYRAPQDKHFPDKKYRFLALPAIQEYEGQIDIWKQRADGTEKIIESEPWKKAQGVDYVPDYPNDLNAMHSAEALLTPDESARYERLLDDLVNRDFLEGNTCLVFPTWHASAGQRAEGFLRIKAK